MMFDSTSNQRFFWKFSMRGVAHIDSYSITIELYLNEQDKFQWDCRLESPHYTYFNLEESSLKNLQTRFREQIDYWYPESAERFNTWFDEICAEISQLLLQGITGDN